MSQSTLSKSTIHLIQQCHLYYTSYVTEKTPHITCIIKSIN